MVFQFVCLFFLACGRGYATAATNDILNEVMQIMNGGFKYTNVPDAEEYDFIVVGSGSAGSVIANRLTEVNRWKVLLLEAGRHETTFSKTPMLAPLLLFTDYNWGYTTEPSEKACLGLLNGRCAWPRGKALGGTSAINCMVYARGNPDDYDRWHSLGNPGWSYDDVLPYFLKSEDANLINADPRYHRSGGYLRVSNTEVSELAEAFFEAGRELGYEKIDPNTREQIGFSEVYANVKDGYRHSVASAFLEPVDKRANLKIITGARVGKVLIDPTTREAYGVEYVRDDKQFTATARKEVIISAGALNSPQILMLSGVGPQPHLRDLGITPIHDLPVGQTLYDHILYLGVAMTSNTTMSLDMQALLQPNQDLPRIPLIEAYAYIATNESDNKNYPDAEIHLVLLNSFLKHVLRPREDVYQAMLSQIEKGNSIALIPKLLHPTSVGYLRLKSSNPYDHPLFYPNYFSDPDNVDKRTLIAATRFVYKLSKTEAFKKIDLQWHYTRALGCEDFEDDSDEYWSCALELLSTSGFHQTSTCKMGPPDDPKAVVDNELKVYGIKRLRVADASVIPIPTSDHLNAPAIMIGEKAADLIKAYWKNNEQSCSDSDEDGNICHRF